MGSELATFQIFRPTTAFCAILALTMVHGSLNQHLLRACRQGSKLELCMKATVTSGCLSDIHAAMNFLPTFARKRLTRGAQRRSLTFANTPSFCILIVDLRGSVRVKDTMLSL